MSTILSDLSESLANSVQTVSPGIVRVEGRRRMAASGIIWSADGLIMTANHVVKQQDNLAVGLPDGERLKADLVGRDPSTDLALLKVDTKSLSPLKRTDVSSAVGHLVLALGRPGRTVQATLGIISALGDSWRTGAGGKIDRYLQTDVVMYPGFSGGPLVNSQGQLLGLNTSALARGVSLTIPLSTVEKVAAVLRDHGRMRRGYLGVSTQPARLPQNVQEETGQDSGLLIVSVEGGSPAHEGSLVMGDAIIGLDSEVVRHHDDLLSLLTGERIGKTVPIRIVRGGIIQILEVEIGER